MIGKALFLGAIFCFSVFATESHFEKAERAFTSAAPVTPLDVPEKAAAVKCINSRAKEIYEENDILFLPRLRDAVIGPSIIRVRKLSRLFLVPQNDGELAYVAHGTPADPKAPSYLALRTNKDEFRQDYWIWEEVVSSSPKVYEYCWWYPGKP